jgi:adenosyl cobinamide kinase/adenosyl cobinamide phosphate guanylyltransferase
MIRVIAGPPNCGKSALAESEVSRCGLEVTYLATLPAMPCFAAKIAAHRRRRPVSWRVIELDGALPTDKEGAWRPGTALLLDGLGVHVRVGWLARGRRGAVQELRAELARFVRLAQTHHMSLWVVTSLPAVRLERDFHRTLRAVNSDLFAVADFVTIIRPRCSRTPSQGQGAAPE